MKISNYQTSLLYAIQGAVGKGGWGCKKEQNAFSRDPKFAEALGTGNPILKYVVVLTVVSIFVVI